MKTPSRTLVCVLFFLTVLLAVTNLPASAAGKTKLKRTSAAYSITATQAPHGTISPSGVTMVNAEDTVVYSITPDTGYHVVNLIIDADTISPQSTYTFANDSADHTITASFAADVYEIVATQTPNGSVTPAGTTNVNYGSSQAYTITPETGYHIVDLQIDSLTHAASTSYTFSSVSRSHTISADFSKYIITATAGPNGAISPSGVDSVVTGATAIFTITPATGYHLDSLFVDGSIQIPALADTFTNVSANHTIRAVFLINSYFIVAVAGAHGSISPAGSINLNYGVTQIFTFTPDSGYHVAYYMSDNVRHVAAPADTFANVSANHTVVPYFAINTYTLSSSAGPHGTITPTGNININFGATQIFKFAPSAGYVIDSVLVDSVLQPLANADTLRNVAASHSIRVTFAITTFTVTASAGPNGSITPSGAAVVNYGSNAAYTIAPNPGYGYDSLVVDGKSVGVARSYTFVNVAAAHTITATFQPAPDSGVTYRTFTYDSLVVKKSLIKKNIGSYFEFSFLDDAHLADSVMIVKFGSKNASIVYASGLSVTTTRTYTYFTGLRASDTIHIIGYSTSPKSQIIKGVWFNVVHGSAAITGVFPIVARPDLPMPNAANIRDNTFKLGAFTATAGLIVGIPEPKNARNYGWVQISSSTGMYNSLTDGARKHAAIPDGFNFTGKKVQLSPKTQDNVVFADLLTLKFNMALSAIGTTAPGLADLVYNRVGSPFNKMPLSQIALVGDSMMTFHGNYTLALVDSLDAVLRTINSAFSGPMDTVSWSSTLELTGVATLAQAGILTSSKTAPVTIAPVGTKTLAASDVPKTAKLEQNYPNPFNPTTKIKFDLPAKSVVTIKVFNVIGQEVTTLVDNASLAEGSHEIEFNGANFASGLYFCRMNASGSSEKMVSIIKMMLLK
jgi:hypothetical protein